MTQPRERWIRVGDLRLYAREWNLSNPDTEGQEFLLLHGLSSNAATWDLVASRLVQHGYRVISVDQRGHGLSDKPDDGYDFATIAQDVHQVIDQLGLNQPVLAGQSWGGNVILEFATRYPGIAAGYIFVDGGFLNLRQRGKWEEISVELRPPELAGTPLEEIRTRIGSMRPGWIPNGVNVTLKNFEILPGGTVRPWLTLDRHMAILRAIYDQDVTALFPQVTEPVLICAAEDGMEWSDRKRKQVDAAQQAIPDVEVRWFEDTAHDIHVDRPDELSRVMLGFADRLLKVSS